MSKKYSNEAPVKYAAETPQPVSAFYSIEDPVMYREGPPKDALMRTENEAGRALINGMTEEEHEKRQLMKRRALKPEDIPNEPWLSTYDGLYLREDGALVGPSHIGELGWIDAKNGKVLWVKA